MEKISPTEDKSIKNLKGHKWKGSYERDDSTPKQAIP